MSDYSSVKSFSSPSTVSDKLKTAGVKVDKEGAATQYLKEGNTFGFFDVKKDKDGKVMGRGDISAANVKSFMDNFTMMTPNNYDSEVARNSRHRKMFLNAVTDPKQLLQTKSAVASELEEGVKGVRDQLFVTLIGYEIEPVKARRDADMLSKLLLDGLMDYLNTEMYPSQIEDNIKRAALARGSIKDVSS